MRNLELNAPEGLFYLDRDKGDAGEGCVVEGFHLIVGAIPSKAWEQQRYYSSSESAERPPHVMCNIRTPNGGWVCNRRLGHKGRHVADLGPSRNILAIWASEPERTWSILNEKGEEET